MNEWMIAFLEAIENGSSPIEAEKIADARVSEKAAEPNVDYLSKLKSLIMSRIADGDLTDADLRAIIRVAAGFAGGMSSARKRQEAKAAAEEETLWVGFNLPIETAQNLALSVPGAEPASDLHLTLAYLGPRSNFPSDAIDRANAALKNFALSHGPIEICVNGLARFEQGVLYAPVEGEELGQLHFEICHALRMVGLYWEPTHEFTPHVTLMYLDPEQDVPSLVPPYVELMLDSITFNPGNTTYALTTVPSSTQLQPLMMAEFMEPPSTIPVLPRPGKYEHPSYGTIDMTDERLDRFVDNFKRVVYQDRIPIDLEHDTKLSGAAGWITDLVKNSDGSVDARVEWTDMGRTALERDRYLYVSPEWYSQWASPIDGVKHDDVLIGAALTTRPFFKPPALRSLAATEERVEMPEKKEMQVEQSPVVPTSFAELENKVVSLEAAKAASAKLAESYAEGLKKANERIAAMEDAAQTRRFNDEVLGKSDSNNLRWFGEIESHIRILKSLAAAEGEDSDAFKAYVAQNRAFAEQMQKSNLFHEVGSSNTGQSSADPQAKINALATARASEKNIPFRDALKQVANENPNLYREAAESARIKV